MKRHLLKLLALLLTFAACVCWGGCQAKPYHYCVIDGKKIEFVGNAKKQDWEKPLAKLLSNVLLPISKGGDIVGEYPAVDANAPAIPDFSECGLFDVTMDGVPELLIIPRGSTGSSGAVVFQVYDIYSGKYIGDISGDWSGDLCMYYHTETDELQAFSRYRFREGWAGRTRYIDAVKYDTEREEYNTVPYLKTTHLIDATVTSEGEGDIYIGSWKETYPKTEYYLYGKQVSLDDYYAEYDQFTRDFLPISRTRILLFSKYELTETESDPGVIGKLLAKQLLSSEQCFIRFD